MIKLIHLPYCYKIYQLPYHQAFTFSGRKQVFYYFLAFCLRLLSFGKISHCSIIFVNMQNHVKKYFKHDADFIRLHFKKENEFTSPRVSRHINYHIIKLVCFLAGNKYFIIPWLLYLCLLSFEKTSHCYHFCEQVKSAQN